MMYRIALLFILFSLPAWSQSPVTVMTDLATREEIAATMAVSGVVLSREDSLLSTELEGRITEIAEAGQRFAAGAVIARLDTHVLELERQAREAEIERLRANLAWLDRQTKRLEELATRNNTAASDLDKIRSNHGMLVQEINQAKVRLDRSLYDLERAQIRAPFAGIVVAREASLGEYVTQGSPLLRLVNTDAAEISVTAPLQVARFIQEGDEVSVGNQFKQGPGYIRSIIAVGDSRSHMMELRITPSDASWYIGEAVNVTLPASERQLATTVDRDALVLRDSSSYIFVVDKDGLAERVPVELGPGFGDRISITGQVRAGDEVIIRGAERLQTGQRINRIKDQVTIR